MAGIRQKLSTAFKVFQGVREARQILRREKQAQERSAGRLGGAAVGTATSFGGAGTRTRPDYNRNQALQAPESVPGAQTTHTDMSKVYGPFGYLKELYKRFNGDQCPAWAAALSFFAILSFVPILICGIAVLGFLIQNPQTAAAKVQQLLTALIPGGNDANAAAQIIKDANIQQQAESLMRNRGVAGIIGIASLFWAATRIFVNAATPMNAAFRVKETRNFLSMQGHAIGLFFGAGLLFLLSLLPASGPSLLRKLPFLSGLQDPSPWYMDVVFFVIGVAINAAMFTVIYRFLPSPSARVSWRQATVAGTIVAVLWEAAKQGFALYLRNFGGNASYNKVYGSLGGLIILILWVYYTSMILLLGAEIAKLYQDHKEQKERLPNAPA